MNDNLKTTWSLPLVSLVILLISFGIICIPTSGKLIDFLGYPLSISIFYFPFICIISDVITEVYGFKVARQALWFLVITQILSCIIFQLVAVYPPSIIFADDIHFHKVLSQAFKMVFSGVLAVYLGDITNNYILAKMKVAMNGKAMWLRFLISTIFGQTVNTAAFYVLALSSVIPMDIMLKTVLMASFAKVIVEGVVLPFSIMLSNKLKKIENLDVYDKETDFNFFKF